MNPNHGRSKLGAAQAQLAVNQNEAALETLSSVAADQLTGIDQSIHLHLLQSQAYLQLGDPANSLQTANLASYLLNNPSVSSALAFQVAKAQAQGNYYNFAAFYSLTD